MSTIDASNISNSIINGGSLTWVKGDLNLHPQDASRDRASGAFHNSAERFDAPKCHPQTRRAILREIIEWVQANNGNDYPFLWMYGPAGSGKSSIAQSIAEVCAETGQLAASFFFARTAFERNNASRLVATIAYQLTISIPSTTDQISEALLQDPAIFSRSLQAQAEALIVLPILNLAKGTDEGHAECSVAPKFILIDGLDECGDGGSQRRILDALWSAVRSLNIPLRFLIASRPEHDIRNFFNQGTVSHLTRALVLDDKYEPDADIRTFLLSRFNDIRQGHPSGAHIPSSWPTEGEITSLVEKSSGQFIYASTVMKFVESPRHWPSDRLDIIFGLMSPGRNTPFAELDSLYAHIFNSVGAHIDRAMEVFTFLLFKASDVGAGVDIVEDFLCLREGELQTILTDLHSVIHVPEALETTQQLRLFHASLGDFLMDRSRSGNFFVGVREGHAQMMRYCLRRLTYSFSSPLREFPASSSKIADVDLFKRTEPAVQRMSYVGLMRHYPAAYSSHGLLQDLYLFNFEADRLQRYLDNPQILHHRYLSQVDTYLKASLARYPQVPASFRLFAASTLDKFPRHCRIVFDILSLKYRKGYYSFPHGGAHSALSNGVRELDTTALRFSFADNRGIESFRDMVNEFLTDEARAGIYHVDAGKYMDLAPFLIDLLANPHLFDGVEGIGLWSMQKCCFDLLIDILWCIPADHELAQYLYGNPIMKYAKHLDAKQQEQMIRAVSFYIEKCNRNPATVAALRQQAMAPAGLVPRGEDRLPSPRASRLNRQEGPSPSSDTVTTGQDTTAFKKWVSGLFKWPT
ncbi:hypothetical protein CVT26_010146 [Gymnopilus dilepis]|uniref:Nephrocystin 3-like N-terminal domain-containing protein n=1 Tax=Gymnopilus dilepis TaxID=231916 RepID=A0A409YS18_9AGAR|nr:hypothetical protein CVT26_010146 [Gymnopilus dilepis]